MKSKLPIAPTEASQSYLREAIARAEKHKAASDESARLARQALRRGEYDDVARFAAQAQEQRASYHAAAAIAGSWRLPDPTHYVAPDSRGGLPEQGSKEDRPLCGAKAHRAVTCVAEHTTCAACVKILLKQIDRMRGTS